MRVLWPRCLCILHLGHDPVRKAGFLNFGATLSQTAGANELSFLDHAEDLVCRDIVATVPAQNKINVIFTEPAATLSQSFTRLQPPVTIPSSTCMMWFPSQQISSFLISSTIFFRHPTTFFVDEYFSHLCSLFTIDFFMFIAVSQNLLAAITIVEEDEFNTILGGIVATTSPRKKPWARSRMAR